MKNFITEIFRNPPVLFTERLMLRKMERFDSEDMFEYASLPETTEYLLWSPHPDLNYTRKYIALIGGQYKNCQFYAWAVCLRDGGKMIGTCGFTKLDAKNMCGEIGYVINPAYRGKGYAAEAAKKVMEFGFDDLALQRIEARYMIDNTASKRVMDKLKMQFEGVHRNAVQLRGEFVSVGVCSILRDEFK